MSISRIACESPKSPLWISLTARVVSYKLAVFIFSDDAGFRTMRLFGLLLLEPPMMPSFIGKCEVAMALFSSLLMSEPLHRDDMSLKQPPYHYLLQYHKKQFASLLKPLLSRLSTDGSINPADP
ncbi:uncharacterized protein TRIREDRAFT_105532 [Trichoderma reesei QM6a]|uniref:Predicted protein n=2 Tax=Hypocrea jecorina TaxID=51453 RepID=G0RF27_HYPJQ|nr:uncharacterized protein TRIREDRAFT_105532 [Trichoderma reesei QM6a]EGR50414.1 predicted protein [Trichoderma reesei QM6a]ETS03897.1 hypothetical protein M419DRAFT_74369 [Trichoderma reesei RUT C-30]